MAAGVERRFAFSILGLRAGAPARSCAGLDRRDLLIPLIRIPEFIAANSPTELPVVNHRFYLRAGGAGHEDGFSRAQAQSARRARSGV